MPTNTERTIGIIRLADEHYGSELVAEPRDLASALRRLVGDKEVATEQPGPTRKRFCVDTVDNLQSANSIRVSANVNAIYSQLEDELRRLTA